MYVCIQKKIAYTYAHNYLCKSKRERKTHQKLKTVPKPHTPATSTACPYKELSGMANSLLSQPLLTCSRSSPVSSVSLQREQE